MAHALCNRSAWGETCPNRRRTSPKKRVASIRIQHRKRKRGLKAGNAAHRPSIQRGMFESRSVNEERQIVDVAVLQSRGRLKSEIPRDALIVLSSSKAVLLAVFPVEVASIFFEKV